MTAANAAKAGYNQLISGAPEGNRALDIQLGKLRLACHIRVAKTLDPNRETLTMLPSWCFASLRHPPNMQHVAGREG